MSCFIDRNNTKQTFLLFIIYFFNCSFWLYYVAVPLNLVLRLAWILTVAPGAFGITLQNDLLQFCLAIAEQTRRFIWNFIRMENEGK
jgi:hypothetical protein